MIDGFVVAIFLVCVAGILRSFYRHKNKPYASGKTEKLASPESFKYLDPYLRASTFAFAVGSMFSDSSILLKTHHSLFAIYVGVGVGALAVALFIEAKVTLGYSYSPCFDMYMPPTIVRSGVYAYLRHPIYTANLMLLASLYISTGSLWIVLNWLILFLFYDHSAKLEEKVLCERYPEYRFYARTTDRYIPGFRSARKFLRQL